MLGSAVPPKTEVWYQAMSKTRGQNHYKWKGGKKRTDTGYILIHKPEHPHVRKSDGFIGEHRLVMEEKLGRYLLPTEVVHHLNHVKYDNRPENLALFPSRGDHIKHHVPHGPNPDRNPLNTLSQRQCPRCKSVYPLTPTYFHRARNEINGFEYICKICACKRRHR
jgi:hypothetical protein